MKHEEDEEEEAGGGGEGRGGGGNPPRVALIKSSNPHLAGGEKIGWVTQPIHQQIGKEIL